MAAKKTNRANTKKLKLAFLGVLFGITILSIAILPNIRTVFNTNASELSSAPSAAPTPTPGTVSLLKPATTWTTHKNIRYSNATTNSRNLLDVYVPNNGVAKAPLIVIIHNTTAWNSGAKEDCASHAQSLVKKGFVIACPNFRLASQAPFPAQIIDVKTAIRGLRANASSFRIYPDKIGIWGFSAAGHLSLMAGLSANKPEWEKGEWLSASSSVQAVQSNSAPTNITTWLQDPCCKSFEPFVRPFIGGPIATNPDKAAAASPITYVAAGAPPITIIHGDKDTVVPYAQSTTMYNNLLSAGNPVTMRTIVGKGHELEASTTHLNNIVAFFDKHLRP